jgi:hypothetical protein
MVARAHNEIDFCLLFRSDGFPPEVGGSELPRIRSQRQRFPGLELISGDPEVLVVLA